MSAFSLLWLPQVLRDAGLNVIEVPGWQNRGHGDEGKVLGVLCHHTCGPLHGDLPDLKVLVDGRPDLGGPLCNLGLGREGNFWMIAAGKGWHAGAGNWHGVTDGNSHLIGIEAENAGTDDSHGHPTDPWPAVQMDAYKRGCAAILRHVGAPASMCAGHKEYALPHGRKDDPDFDMDAFRSDVAAMMIDPPPIAAAKAAAAPAEVTHPAPAAVAAGVEVSADGETLTIDGLRFARSLFMHLAQDGIGTVVRIVGRGDGAVMLQHVDAELPAGSPLAPLRRAGIVNVDALCVRALASASSARVRLLNKGDRIAILTDVDTGKPAWLAVDGGFVASRYIDMV